MLTLIRWRSRLPPSIGSPVITWRGNWKVGIRTALKKNFFKKDLPCSGASPARQPLKARAPLSPPKCEIRIHFHPLPRVAHRLPSPEASLRCPKNAGPRIPANCIQRHSCQSIDFDHQSRILLLPLGWVRPPVKREPVKELVSLLEGDVAQSGIRSG